MSKHTGIVLSSRMHNGNVAPAFFEDTSRYKHACTITGATWVRNSKGVWMLSFDGVNDTVSIPSSASLKLGNFITIMLWIKLTGAGGGWEWLISKNRDYSIGYTAWDAKLSFRGSFSGAGVNAEICPSLQTMPLNIWRHIAATYDGSIGRLYFNGIQDNTGNLVDTIIYTDDTLCLCSLLGTGEYLSCDVGECVLLNRVLTSLEIHKHYEATKEWYL